MPAPARPGGPVAVALDLPFRPPLSPDGLFGHLAATAVPGVEEWRDGAYRRTLRLPHGTGTATLRPPAAGASTLSCRLVLADARDEGAAVARCRFLLDLDADPVAVDGALRADEVLRPLVDAVPGRRVPRTVDPAELLLRAVLGQQVSTAAARTHAARLVRAHGEEVVDDEGGLTHLFPAPEALRALDPAALALPAARRATVLAVVAALCADGPSAGALGLGDATAGGAGEPAAVRARLEALPGVGPWTAGVVAMRALGDPDAFLPGDLGVRQAARRLGLPEAPGALTRRAQGWRPWRAYAVQHLWATGDHPVNRLPGA
nr:AlkA N-terminal domain-containing protein [Kineococcus xinjiangensis]